MLKVLERLDHIGLRRGSAVTGAQDKRHWIMQGRKEMIQLQHMIF